jgi:hypothetical protein
VQQQDPVREDAPQSIPPRRGAIGKALIVWLASGSLGLAVVAYLIFAGAGC